MCILISALHEIECVFEKRQLKEMKIRKNAQIGNQRAELQNKIDSLQSANDKLQKSIDEKDEILAHFVKKDEQHQILSNEWKQNEQMLNTKLRKMKQAGFEMAELLLQQKNENNQLQRNAVKHSLNAIKASKDNDALNSQLMECKKLNQTHLGRIDALNEKYTSLANQHVLIKQEKCALIKEVKKLRQIMIEKDEKKSEILSKMSENEMIYSQQIKKLNQEIDSLKAQNFEIMDKFKFLVSALADCNSNIESFCDTINNFSCCGLMHSYENEYDARCKSTELLNDALHTNINEEIIKLHKEINFTKIRDELNEEEKTKSLFDESKIQMNYMQLSALKLVLEYIESIKQCNAMYIKYNPKMNDGEQDEENGVYNYVSSGVNNIASMVNSFGWKVSDKEQGEEKEDIELSEEI